MKWNDVPDWSYPIASSLLKNVQMKDEYTFAHCCRVGKQARKLAKAAGLNEYEQRLVEFIGLFHDLGKVGIPESVLCKPGRLDEKEFELMKSHPEKSVEIISPLAKEKFFEDMIQGILYHHERFDGQGYPNKLGGENIPLEARIITVVDTVDAMMYTRPYRQALPWTKVQQELLDFSGTQFDAALVKIYLQSIRFYDKAEFEQPKAANVVDFVIKKSA